MIQSDHADLLNELSQMSLSFQYAMRGATLRKAEQLIVAQEQEIDRLKAGQPAPNVPGQPTAADYLMLQEADVNAEGAMAEFLNRIGLCHWTVCPRCHVDDFTHVEGCSLIPED